MPNQYHSLGWLLIMLSNYKSFFARLILAVILLLWQR